MTEKHRQTMAINWIAKMTNCSDTKLLPLAGDASFRRYFRAQCGGQNYVLMDAPLGQEDPALFNTITLQLEQQNIPVPHIYHADLEQGFLLLEDFGDTLYLDYVDETNADTLYHKAIDTLLEIQAIDAKELPRFSSDLLLEEMHLFTDWYCKEHCHVTFTSKQTRIIENTFTKLIDNAIAQPQTFVHRDYHSRNLLFIESTKTLGVIDYQDAVYGPLTYDLVSLLKDCYICWPQQRVLNWMNYFLTHSNICINASFSDKQFKCWFDLMGVQRHLKASGIFARLYHRDGKAGYIKDIPNTLGYITTCLADYPDYADFRNILINLPPTP